VGIFYLLFLSIETLSTNAKVKNNAPKKHGVTKGLAPTAQPVVQTLSLSQLFSSRPKLPQAKRVPKSKIKNWVLINFVIYLY